MTKKTGELGPIYSVELIDELPLSGSMTQAMPSASDLSYIAKKSERVVAGYEVLLAHWHEQNKIIEDHLHQRRCFACGNEAWHKDNAGEFVRCSKCQSMDTRKMVK